MYITCENPVVIFHPNVISYLHRASYYTAHNEESEFSYISSYDMELIYNDPLKWLRDNFPPCSSVHDVKAYSLVTEDGEVFPVYMEVPCNACFSCRVKKLNSLSQQMEFELLTAVESCSNFFVTLTYNNKHLPKSGLCRKDVQDYIKRLRSYISKNVGEDESKQIKFMYSGEYGSLNRRPHYHLTVIHFPIYKLGNNLSHSMLIFEYLWSDYKNVNMKNCIPFSDYSTNYYGKLTPESQLHYDTYNKGYVHVRKIVDNNSARYVAKYVGKGSAPLDGMEKPFFQKSINFGMAYFNERVKPQLNTNKKNVFTYVGLDYKVKENMSVCQYYLNKYLPSISRVIPPKVRLAFLNMRSCLYEMTRYKKFQDKKYYYIQLFEEHLPPSYMCIPTFRLFFNSLRDFKMRKMFSFKFFDTIFHENFKLVRDFFEYYNDNYKNKIDELSSYFNYRSKFIIDSMSDMYNMSFEELQEQISDKIMKARKQYHNLFTHAKLHDKLDYSIFQPKPKTNNKEKLWQIFSKLQKDTWTSPSAMFTT